MKNRKFIVGLIIFSLFVFSGSVVRAEDEEQSKVVKAADAIIKGLPDACKAGLDFSKMTPAQRIDFVITGAESKIQDEVAGRLQDVMKERLATYAKEKLSAKVFMEIGVPQIRNAYVLGTAVNWTKINNEIASKVDTNMAALGAGIKAAQIGWGAIKAYQTGDFTSVARSIGGEISDMLAEAYIPGYGYIKIGAAMVEFLGNYVLDYATDTAVEGMLNSMYSKKSNPQWLAQWLIDKSPQDIMKDLDGKWNDGEAFGYLFREQGTDKGDEAMKSRLQTVLINMRGEVLVKKKEQEEKEKQAQQDIEDYLRKYRSAKDALEATANQAKADFDVKFAPILEFKKKVNVFRKQDVQESLVEIEETMDDAGPGGAGSSMDYTPFNGGPLISEMEGAYSEIKEIPSGYDSVALIRMVTAYRSHRQKAIESAQKVNAANRLKASVRVDAQIKPIQQQMAALMARIGESSSNLVKHNALALQVSEIGKQHWLACVENLRKQGVDFAAFAAEEKIVELEAQERADKLNVSIEEGFKKIEAGIQIARRERDAANKALLNEVQEKFYFPSLYSINEFVKTATCSGICGPAESIKNGELELYAPGNFNAAREEALSNIKKIQQDMKLVSVYTDKEKEILKQYQIQILNLRKAFESLVPKNLWFTPGTGETPEDAAYRKREEDRVEKNGARSASQETWGHVSAPYINFPSRLLAEKVEPIRYFDTHIADLDALKKQRDQQFEEGLRNIQDMVSTIDFYADLDRIAVSIKSMGNNLQKVLGPYVGVNFNFRTKNGKTDLLVPAAASDGAKSLEEMKKAWKEYQPFVEKMRANVKAYGNGLKYLSTDQGPDRAIAALAQFEAIPGTIASFEKRMAQTEAERVSSKAQVEEELKRLKRDVETIKNTKNLQVYEKTLQNLRSTFDYLFPHLDDGTMRGVFKDEYVKLRDDVEAYAKVHEASEKDRMEKYRSQYATEQAAVAAAEQGRKEKANTESVKRANPLLYYGYQVLNPRVNSYAVDNMSGNVVVTKDKLVQGQIQLTARLNHIDHAKTLLISEDGGRTWKEIGLSRDINYTFMPIPQKQYQMTLRIKTDDMVDVAFGFFAAPTTIIYQDADFQEEVVRTVKAFADAYERQDFGVFSQMISRDFLGDKTALEEGARLDFDLFTDIRLKIYVNRVNQRGDLFVAETKWDKDQTPRKTGQQQKTSGKTTLVFTMEDGMVKLQNLRGNLMVATLSPEIAQTSGLSQTVINDITTARDARNPTQPGAGTTEDAGGVTTTASSGLTVQTATITGGFDLATGAAVGFGSGDFSAETADGMGNMKFIFSGIKPVPGATLLSDVQTATAGGYLAATNAVSADEVYLVYMNNHYAKIRIVSFVPSTSITIEYAYQTEEDNTDLTTQ